MKDKNVPFEEVYDIFAIRIILKSTPESEKGDCWNTYSIITDMYDAKTRSVERLDINTQSKWL